MGPQVEQAGCITTGVVSEDKSTVPLSTYRREFRLLLIIAALVVTLDQLSKLWVRANLSPASQLELLPGFLDLVLVRNYGAAFGLLPHQTGLIIAVSIAGLLIMSLFLHRFPPANTLGITSFALIVGGTVGNLVDRFRPPHYVTDFIRVHLHPLFSWPAFNIADAAMIVGILALIYYFHRSGVFRKAYERTHSPKD